jgi:hypothetical protein
MENQEISVIENNIIREVLNQFPTLYDDLNFNEYDIKEKLEKNAYLYEQFRVLWLQEKNKLRRIEILRDEYIGKLYQELKNGDRKLTKTEIERYFIPSDEKAIKYEKLYMKQKIRTETFEALVESFKTQSWNMSTFIKNMQL